MVFLKYRARFFTSEQASVEILIKLISKDHNSWSSREATYAIIALGWMKDDRAVMPLIHILSKKKVVGLALPSDDGRTNEFYEDIYTKLRREAAVSLARLGDLRAIDSLHERLSDEDENKYVREAVEKALSALCDG